MKTFLRSLILICLSGSLSLVATAETIPQSQSQSSTQPTRAQKPADGLANSSVNTIGDTTTLASLAGKRLSLDEMFMNLPRRVASKSGEPGDMVNLLVIGTKEQVAAALQSAGWVQPDRTAQDAIVHAIKEAMAHTAYSEMPMSQLYLFGRPQDFSFAEGMPIQIVAERNHFRLWGAPWLDSGGRAVWAGAGTHDIGIERDQAGQLTHRIDPNVDSERDYILETLQDAGKVEKSLYVTPTNPIRQALTATGDDYRSDGRILVIYLK
jgi:hypothetical protein